MRDVAEEEQEPDDVRSEQGDSLESDPFMDRRAQVRRRQLLLAIEQHAPGYHSITGDGVRYAAEIAHATAEEWDWMAAHVRDNPHVLDGERLADSRIHELNQETARRAFAAATEAIKSGDYTRALDRLDDAEVHWPRGHPDRGGTWDRYRNVVLGRARTSLTSASQPDPRSGSDSPQASHGTDAAREAPALARAGNPTPIPHASATADEASADVAVATTGGTRNTRGR